MAKYTNITSASPTTLITKGSGISGAINKITICNNSDNPATDISLHLWAGGGGDPTYKIVHNVTIPSGATLVLEDNLSFDTKLYNLRITNAGTDPDLTVIIK